MESLFLKGTAIGFSCESWKNDPNLLASWLISYLETWQLAHFDESGRFRTELAPEVRKRYGEVKAAIQAIQNDIHNLAIAYHQMNYVLNDEKIGNGLKMLYLGNLTEYYIINIRTIYDFMAVFARLAADRGQIGQGHVSTDSLTRLLKGIKDNWERSNRLFSEPVVSVYTAMDDSLCTIRLIRDAIVHDGKDSIVTIKNAKPYFRVPKTINTPYETLLPDILDLKQNDYPLFPYLQKISNDLFMHMHNLGVVLSNDAYTKNNTYKAELPALIGICIPTFVSFLEEDFSLS